MRYEVYDEDNNLFRRFWEKAEAEKFLQVSWSLVIKPKEKKVNPTVETHGEARW